MEHDWRRRLSKEKILSCLIYHRGSPVFEYYKNSKAETGLQTINSCTKSVLSSLVGILIDRGLLAGVDEPINRFFGPQLAGEKDERKRGITIAQLLDMSAGWDWPEFGEWRYFAPMVYSNDIIRFILDRQLLTRPGEDMNYNSGCSHLLSAIVQMITGTTVHEFANESLFKPLGITRTLWHEKQGVSLGADGLRLTARDMAAFGQLFLNLGMAGSRQVVSGEWVRCSTTARHHTYPDIGHYGYHWWISSHAVNNISVDFYFALGYGGQLIVVVPKIEMVGVFTSRMYHDTLWPLRFFRSYVLTSQTVLLRDFLS